MQNAYDLKELAESLKQDGLKLSEQALKTVITKTFDWAKESAKLSATPFDDIAVPVLEKVRDYALEKVDQVDGVVEAVGKK